MGDDSYDQLYAKDNLVIAANNNHLYVLNIANRGTFEWTYTPGSGLENLSFTNNGRIILDLFTGVQTLDIAIDPFSGKKPLITGRDRTTFLLTADLIRYPPALRLAPVYFYAVLLLQK